MLGVASLLVARQPHARELAKLREVACGRGAGWVCTACVGVHGVCWVCTALVCTKVLGQGAVLPSPRRQQRIYASLRHTQPRPHATPTQQLLLVKPVRQVAACEGCVLSVRASGAYYMYSHVCACACVVKRSGRASGLRKRGAAPCRCPCKHARPVRCPCAHTHTHTTSSHTCPCRRPCTHAHAPQVDNTRRGGWLPPPLQPSACRVWACRQAGCLCCLHGRSPGCRWARGLPSSRRGPL